MHPTTFEVRFGLFLAQIAPSLQNKKRALHANFRLDLDKLAGPRHFQMLALMKNRGKMIHKILMLLLNLSSLNELDRSFYFTDTSFQIWRD